MSEAAYLWFASRRLSILLVVFACIFVLSAASAMSPDRIIAESDRIRNPDQPFRVLTTLIEYVSGKPRNRTVLTVYSKEDAETGQFRSLVKFVEPPRDAGKAILSAGVIMWFYDPAARTSVRVSPQQRLLGPASNGDVISVNLAKNYEPTLVGQESILDADNIERLSFHFDMSASNESATYKRVEYWVEVDSYRPIKGRFYSDSGRLLKVAYYRKFEEQLGRTRPTEVIIVDAVERSNVTKITYSSFQPVSIPEAWFQREYLPRLPVE